MYTVTNWPNRDPIRELGGLNVYNFTFNNSINYVDSLGRVPCAPLVVYGVWVVGRWAVSSTARYLVGNVLVTTTIYTTTQTRTKTITEYKDECNQCVIAGTTSETETVTISKMESEEESACNGIGEGCSGDALTPTGESKSEPSTRKGSRGGTSVQEGYTDAEGRPVTKHTIYDSGGKIVHGPHYRPGGFK